MHYWMHVLFIGVSGVRLLSEVASHSACLQVSGKLAVIWSHTVSLPPVPTGNSPLIWQVLFVLQSRPMHQPMSGRIHLSRHKISLHFTPSWTSKRRRLWVVTATKDKNIHISCSQYTWLLMSWRRKEPEYHQPLYWPTSLENSAFSTTGIKWVVVCKKMVFRAWICNWISQHYVGCNRVSMSWTPAFCTWTIISIIISGVIIYIESIGWLVCCWVSQWLLKAFLCSKKIDDPHEVMNLTCETKTIRVYLPRCLPN